MVYIRINKEEFKLTIGELIEKLSQYDKNLEVKVYDYEYNDIYKIDNVEFLGNKIVIFYE